MIRAPFDDKAICDVCETRGAYTYGDEYLCRSCAELSIPDYDEDVDYYHYVMARRDYAEESGPRNNEDDAELEVDDYDLNMDFHYGIPVNSE